MEQVVKFIEGIFPNKLTATFVILLVTLAFWIYKESRASYISNVKIKQEKMEKVATAYMELDLEIDNYFKGASTMSDFINKLSKHHMILPYESLKRFQKLKSSTDEAEKNIMLRKYQKEFQSVILKLKYVQEDASFGSDRADIVQSIENYVKARIAPFIMPLAHTFIILFSLFFIIYLILIPIASEGSILLQIKIVFNIFSLFLGIMVLLATVNEGISNKRFKKPLRDTVIFVIFTVVFISMILFVKVWFSGIILVAVIILYAFILSKYSLKELDV